MIRTLTVALVALLAGTAAQGQVPYTVRGVFEDDTLGLVEVLCAARKNRFACMSGRVGTQDLSRVQSGAVPADRLTLVSLRGDSKIGPSKQRLLALYSGLEFMRARISSPQIRRKKPLPAGSVINGRSIAKGRLVLTQILPLGEGSASAHAMDSAGGRTIFDPTELPPGGEEEDDSLLSWILQEESRHCREWLESIGCQSWINTVGVDSEGYILDGWTVCECLDTSPPGGGGGPGGPLPGDLPAPDDWVEIDFDDEYESAFPEGWFDDDDDEGDEEEDPCRDCDGSCEGVCEDCCTE